MNNKKKIFIPVIILIVLFFIFICFMFFRKKETEVFSLEKTDIYRIDISNIEGVVFEFSYDEDKDVWHLADDEESVVSKEYIDNSIDRLSSLSSDDILHGEEELAEELMESNYQYSIYDSMDNEVHFSFIEKDKKYYYSINYNFETIYSTHKAVTDISNISFDDIF